MQSFTVQEGIALLKRGVQAVRYGRQGRPDVTSFKLSDDEQTLAWDKRKSIAQHRGMRSLRLADVTDVELRAGHERPNPRRSSSAVVPPHLILSVKISPKPAAGADDPTAYTRDCLDMGLSDEETFGLLVAAFRALVSHHQRSAAGSQRAGEAPLGAAHTDETAAAEIARLKAEIERLKAAHAAATAAVCDGSGGAAPAEAVAPGDDPVDFAVKEVEEHHCDVKAVEEANEDGKNSEMEPNGPEPDAPIPQTEENVAEEAERAAVDVQEEGGQDENDGSVAHDAQENEEPEDEGTEHQDAMGATVGTLGSEGLTLALRDESKDDVDPATVETQAQLGGEHHDDVNPFGEPESDEHEASKEVPISAESAAESLFASASAGEASGSAEQAACALFGAVHANPFAVDSEDGAVEAADALFQDSALNDTAASNPFGSNEVETNPFLRGKVDSNPFGAPQEEVPAKLLGDLFDNNRKNSSSNDGKAHSSRLAHTNPFG